MVAVAIPLVLGVDFVVQFVRLISDTTNARQCQPQPLDSMAFRNTFFPLQTFYANFYFVVGHKSKLVAIVFIARVHIFFLPSNCVNCTEQDVRGRKELGDD